MEAQESCARRGEQCSPAAHLSTAPSHAVRLLIALVIGALAAWIFADVLFRDRLFAYRDTAYLYHPLYRFVEEEWSAGRVPLWNPLENVGTPLAANAIAAVFYPCKLLFRLPVTYDNAFRAYVVLHVLLAAGTSYLLARRWNRSRFAAGLAALAYAFGGCVLFQYCNVIYLVSAAWLPAAFAAADRALVDGCRRAVIACGAALALMILGGDPQTAYHAFLLIVLYAFLLKRASRASDVNKPPVRVWRLVAISCAALLVSAVQVFPSMELTRRSDRAAYEHPRSLWELSKSWMASNDLDTGHESVDWSIGLRSAAPSTGSHEASIYQFSLSPWRLAEFVWPNVSGRSFPINRRWLSALPAEGRVWVPTLYSGTIPLVLALAAFRLRRAPPPILWMSWCVTIGLLASFGAYGPGWIAAELSRLFSGRGEGTFPVGGAFGGLYWFFNVVLPGYVQFRYPAKWLVVAALGLSQLAAFGLDAVLGGDAQRARRAFTVIAIVSASGLVVACAIRPWWSSWLAAASADSLFGPLDVAGAWRDLASGFLQTWLLGVVGLLLFARRFARRVSYIAPLVLVISALDLAVANSWLVLTAPAELWREPTTLLAELDSLAPDRGSPSEMHRAYRAPYWQPSRFSETSDADRAAESVRWDHATLWPRYNLAAGVGLVTVRETVMSLDYALLVPYLHREATEKRRANDAVRTSSPALDLVGTESLILRADMPSAVVVRRDESERQRVWIAHRVEMMQTIDERSPAVARARTREVLARLSDTRESRVDAVVETNTELHIAQSNVTPGVSADESLTEHCEPVRDDVTRLEVDVALPQAALLVLADAFDPQWEAFDAKTNRELAIHRTNRVLRGVWLPQGRHRVVFVYRPTAFYVGACLSGAAWLALVGMAAVGFMRHVARDRPRSSTTGR